MQASDPASASSRVDPQVFLVRAAQTDDAKGIDLRQIILNLWRSRLLVVLVTLVVSIAGVAYAFLATEWFVAESVVIIRDDSGGTGLLSELNQLGSLAGIPRLGGASGSQEPIGLLGSRGFVGRFVNRPDVLAELRAQYPDDVIAANDGTHENTRLLVDRFIKSFYSVDEDKRSGLVTVSIYWRNPDQAARWANELVRQLDDEMRSRALQESHQHIAYLREKIAATEILPLQQAIARLLEVELQREMSANSAGSYSIIVIDEATPPVKRAWPKRTLIAVLSFLAGLVLAVAYVLMVKPFVLGTIRAELEPN